MRSTMFGTAAVAVCAMLAASSALAAVSERDKAFLDQDVQGARFELAIAKLATTQATKPQIRSYSSRVASDHEKANAALMKLVATEGVTPPSGMSSQDTQKLADLKGLSGPSFDKAYVAEITRINADDEKTSKEEEQSTQDPKIKAYIQRFSSMDKSHKQMGEALKPLVG